MPSQRTNGRGEFRSLLAEFETTVASGHVKATMNTLAGGSTHSSWIWCCFWRVCCCTDLQIRAALCGSAFRAFTEGIGNGSRLYETRTRIANNALFLGCDSPHRAYGEARL